MTVSLTVGSTLANALGGIDVNDSLLGGDSGIDLGLVVNGSYAPVTTQSANTGAYNIYLAHDGTNKITDVKAYMENFATAGFTYGGARDAATDYAKAISLGNASNSSVANNNDGLGGGLWMDMDADATTANQFDQTNFPALVKIFGDNGADGIDTASAFLINSAAMVYSAPAETVATTPVSGEIGAQGDTVLGESAHLKLRIYIPTADNLGGNFQVALVFLYSFTS